MLSIGIFSCKNTLGKPDRFTARLSNINAKICPAGFAIIYMTFRRNIMIA